MKHFVIFSLFCCVVVNCEYYELWTPSFFKQLLTNNTKTFSDHIKNETDVFSNMITEYVDKAKQKQVEFTNDMGILFKGASKQVNETFLNYLKGVSNFGNEIQKQVSDLGNVKKNKDEIKIHLDASQLIAMEGYNVETHTIVTDDGYILKLHRIPHGKNSTIGNVVRQAVILQHGLLSSSIDFVSNGPKKGLAFILSDAGYDVWLGNFRGNTYSRAHIKYSTDESAFWNFSWHEMAMNDLPAMIDYVNSIKKTDKETLYIGHSMGTTALMALLSLKPEYNKRLKAAFCLAPVAYMKNLKSPLAYFAPFASSLGWIRYYLGANEFAPKQIIMNWLALNCDSHFYKEKICGNFIFLIGGYSDAQLDKDNLHNILSHTPAGTSTKTIIHFTQEIRDQGKFQQFDYGIADNVKLYGQKTPPEYPVNKITLPIGLYVSHNDLFVDMSDSVQLYKDLSNPIELYEVPLQDFSHLDFVWATDAKSLLYDHLLKTMEKFKIDQGVLWSVNPFDKVKLDFKWNTVDRK